MRMWMIHSWFCYYLFHDLTYSLRYPPLIFTALVIVSYVCAILVNKITTEIQKTGNGGKKYRKVWLAG